MKTAPFGVKICNPGLQTGEKEGNEKQPRMGLNTGSPGLQTGERSRDKHRFGMPACTRQGIFVSRIMTKHKTHQRINVWMAGSQPIGSVG